MKYMNRISTFALGITVAAALIACAGSTWAQDARDALEPIKETTVTPDSLNWGPADDLPKGAQGALLLGDPSKAGSVIVVRAKFPPNYLVPPHYHDWAETVTLLSGSLGWGMGEKVEKTAELSKPGTLFTLPAKHTHYIWTGDEGAMIQVQFIGPGGITYINQADDPRKK